VEKGLLSFFSWLKKPRAGWGVAAHVPGRVGQRVVGGGRSKPAPPRQPTGPDGDRAKGCKRDAEAQRRRGHACF